mmetsp:Transcript_25702/g.70847  ORF Transcript_25702/g.70847 Transcript_25702/m.70847 type:complete len:257 (-) Transcript_25702:243-1013(-)
MVELLKITVAVLASLGMIMPASNAFVLLERRQSAERPFLQKQKPQSATTTTTTLDPSSIAKATRRRYSRITYNVFAARSSSALLMSSNPEGDEDFDDDEPLSESPADTASNVLGTALECCCSNVRNTGIGTGFYRNGYCSTGEQDFGRHTVCCQVTDDFLAYSQSVGNDLSTPVPEYSFPGLQAGDVWCLCAQRWVQAHEAGQAPRVYLQRTHEKTLSYVPLSVLRPYALDGDAADEDLATLNEQREKLSKLFEQE